MQRPGFACVSTPTVARNRVAATDFVDVSCAAYERDALSSAAADGKFAVNSGCFAARGYSLWRVLRRMEMENVDTQNLAWLTYAMHIEARQATIATMTQHAPRTSVLAPTHGPTALSQVRARPPCGSLRGRRPGKQSRQKGLRATLARACAGAGPPGGGL